MNIVIQVGVGSLRVGGIEAPPKIVLLPLVFHRKVVLFPRYPGDVILNMIDVVNGAAGITGPPRVLCVVPIKC